MIHKYTLCALALLFCFPAHGMKRANVTFNPAKKAKHQNDSLPGDILNLDFRPLADAINYKKGRDEVLRLVNEQPRLANPLQRVRFANENIGSIEGTLLHFAAYYNYPMLVRHLIAAGSPIDAQCRDLSNEMHHSFPSFISFPNNTALMIAIRKGNADVARVLCQEGADITERIDSINGQNAWTYAYTLNNSVIKSIVKDARKQAVSKIMLEHTKFSQDIIPLIADYDSGFSINNCWKKNSILRNTTI